MATLYDDDFQSYAVNDVPPFGNLKQFSGVTKIENSVPGPYSDTQNVHCGGAGNSLQYPNVPMPSTFYDRFSVFMAFYQTPANPSFSGAIISFLSAPSDLTSLTMVTLTVEPDGTLSLIGESAGVICNSGSTSIHFGNWNFVQVNITFSTNGGGKLVYTGAIGLNEVQIASGTLASTRDSSSLPGLYCDAILFSILTVGGNIGRLTIYDALRTIGDDPHPGTPDALVSEGVIETVVSPTTSAVLVSEGVIELVFAGSFTDLSLICPIGSPTVGVAYSGSLVAVGGTPPYTFAIIAGALPFGLTLNASTGEITGTPSTAGTFSYTAEVTDDVAATATAACSLTVTLPCPSQFIPGSG